MLQINTTEGHRCFPRAFTLIELLIVMVVITILAGIIIPVSKYAATQARMASHLIYKEKIKSALEDYRAAYGEYPITPVTNLFGDVINYNDARRHYPANYATYCYYITNPLYSMATTHEGVPVTENSPYTSVNMLTTNLTVETIEGRKVDYCLTYPLMLKQREKGARPFMEFKDETVMHYVYHPEQEWGLDIGEVTLWRKVRGGWLEPRRLRFIRGNPINRPKAIDPLTRCQWKYSSADGLTYSLTNNAF